MTGISKTFQTGSLNFSRISPAINRCKSKILDVAKDDRVIQQHKEDLNGRLKELNIILKNPRKSVKQIWWKTCKINVPQY